jgi:8-oxo-dGTP pyrophosphatase MutT (NUDIX family)
MKLLFGHHICSGVRMNNHYSGIFVYDPQDDMVLCVSDSSHPNDLKMAGGMSVEGETPKATAHREALEELRTQIVDSSYAYVEKVSGRNGTHTRFFLLADKIAGALEKGSTWEVEEKDASGRVVEKLTARWVPLKELADRLFSKQYPAFGAILAKLAKQSPEFCRKHENLLVRFPEPEVLVPEGIDLT